MNPFEQQNVLNNADKPTIINPSNGSITTVGADTALGGFTVSSVGKAVGTTPEDAVKKTYNADLNKKWAW